MKASWRHAVLIAVSAVAICAVALHPPIAQDPQYHAFADRRTILGIPNFSNVASNVAFLIAGVAGLAAVRMHPRGLSAAYVVFFAGVILTAFGSGYYHLAPDDQTLMWDRLPMAVSFMAFFAIVIGEHMSVTLARRSLPLMIAAGVASVAYWRMAGDLRPYLLVQFLPLVLIPLMLLIFPGISQYIWATMAAYVIAKAFETFDRELYAAVGLSGHTLKHVAAAAGAYVMVIACQCRAAALGGRPPRAAVLH